MDEQGNEIESEPLAEARLRHQLGVQSQQINRVFSHHHVPAKVSGGVVRPRIISFNIQTQLVAGLERVRGLKDDLINALGVSDVAVVREEGQWRLRGGRPAGAPGPLLRPAGLPARPAAHNRAPGPGRRRTACSPTLRCESR